MKLSKKLKSDEELDERSPLTFDKKMRECKIAWIDDNHIMSSLYNTIDEYNTKYSRWNMDITALEDLQYTVYGNC